MSLNTFSRSKPRQLASTCHRMLLRAYTTSSPCLADGAVQAQVEAAPPTVDPNTAYTLKEMKELKKAHLNPVGSRRRRAALRNTSNLPFEQLPYQCFQEARKVLAEDREEKLRQIELEKQRIAHVQSKDAKSMGGEGIKKGKLMALRRHLEWLKVHADINDPVIKKKFEDGQGDMNKPIYRYLADTKWRSYNRKLLMQRLETMHVVPDVLAYIDPVVAVSLAFKQRTITPGDFVPSVLSSFMPSMRVQVYDKGPRYFTVVVVDPDVPHLDQDSFTSRCHFLACNILVDPRQPLVPTMKLDQSKIVLPWLPPHAQKGSPYHRLCTFVLEQPGRLDANAVAPGEQGESVLGKEMNVVELREQVRRDGFYMRWFCGNYQMKPVGAHLFRTIYDDWTVATMRRNNIPGWDIELKRKRGEKLPPKKKDTSRYR